MNAPLEGRRVPLPRCHRSHAKPVGFAMFLRLRGCHGLASLCGRRLLRLAGWLTMLVPALVCACGSRSDNRKQIPPPSVTFERSEDSACRGLADAARNCGLLQGEGQPLCREPAESLSRCYTRCLADASCDDLRAFLCSADVALQALASASDCVVACRRQGISCSESSVRQSVLHGDDDAGAADAGRPDVDGGDLHGGDVDGGDAGAGDAGVGDAGVLVVPAEWACDGVDDCGNGRDEANCEGLDNTVSCGDAGSVSGRLRCDGIDDCEGGQDERDCDAATYDCLGGQRIAARLRCDGRTDCVNGRDELGCPPLLALVCGP